MGACNIVFFRRRRVMSKKFRMMYCAPFKISSAPHPPPPLGVFIMNTAQTSYMHVLYPLQGKVLNLSFKTHELIYILDIVTQCILLLTIKWNGHAHTSKERDSRNKNSIILKKTYLAYLIKHLKDKRLEQDNRKAAKGVWVHYCQENFEILNH